ncbi:hypothetical protein [Sphingobacterium bambusae]|uniref:DUF4369 domain-containing protein n=1 Tax=Sphingobacterium bambusae TaxID=662858 RepID=A0ABW6BA49_9SPHI|nr:hypothetical protein [Sphingobacterium bambusae]WPL48684.1 hypothetical protein SCB77_22290 [Sphingobacterium bambusae]
MLPLKLSTVLMLLGMLLCGIVCSAQDSCHCPENKFASTEADTVFRFSSHEGIALCGYRLQDEGQMLFSEFVLTVCGTDTIIDFWDALELCDVSLEDDTLYVNHITSLPTGDNFALVPQIFLIERMYFLNGKLLRTKDVNRTVSTYEPAQIEQVLTAYRQIDSRLDDKTMLLANMLYVATISGSEEARRYFSEFDNRFEELDGAYAEEYHFLQRLLQAWDSDSQASD